MLDNIPTGYDFAHAPCLPPGLDPDVQRHQATLPHLVTTDYRRGRFSEHDGGGGQFASGLSIFAVPGVYIDRCLFGLRTYIDTIDSCAFAVVGLTRGPCFASEDTVTTDVTARPMHSLSCAYHSKGQSPLGSCSWRVLGR